MFDEKQSGLFPPWKVPTLSLTKCLRAWHQNAGFLCRTEAILPKWILVGFIPAASCISWVWCMVCGMVVVYPPQKYAPWFFLQNDLGAKIEGVSSN